MTSEQIEKATYQELVALCPKLGVKYNYQKKNELKEILLLQVNSKNKRLKKDETAKTDAAIQKILQTDGISKSQKMRMLFDLGITSCAEISRTTDSHYSFVYSVITKHIKS